MTEFEGISKKLEIAQLIKQCTRNMNRALKEAAEEGLEVDINVRAVDYKSLQTGHDKIFNHVEAEVKVRLL